MFFIFFFFFEANKCKYIYCYINNICRDDYAAGFSQVITLVCDCVFKSYVNIQE